MDVDEGFEFAMAVCRASVESTLSYLKRSTLPRQAQVRIAYDAMKTHFTIEQIWERINDTEREAIFKEIAGTNPTDILDLRKSGWRREPIEDTNRHKWVNSEGDE